MKIIKEMNQQFLLVVITVLLGCSVAIQGFFVARVWDHEGRLAKVETKVDLCNNSKVQQYNLSSLNPIFR